MRLSLRGFLLGTAALTLALTGCRSTRRTVYFHANADLGAIHRVAILPFQNVTQDHTAGERVSSVFLTEVLALGVFDVAEPGQVAKLLRSERIETVDTLAPPDFKKLGAALKVDAFFLGSISDFMESRSGSTAIPTVTIQLRLVEAESGVTIWSASQTRSGATASARLLGIGGESLTEASRQVIRQELSTLTK